MPEKVFCINVDGFPRKLFSIQERKSADLTIIIKQGNYKTNPGSYYAPESSAIIESHHSIHKSPKIPENVLKHTVKLADKTSIEAYQYTKAIKETNKIAFIHARRCQSLLDEGYKYRGVPSKIVSLGEYNSNLYQLIYFIGATRPDYTFRLHWDRDFSYLTELIGDFKIIVLWTFFTSVSDSTGHFMLPKTFPLDSGRPQNILNDAFVNGMEANEFITVFDMCRRELRDMYFTCSANDAPDISPRTIHHLRVFASSFFENTSETNRRIIEHQRKCSLHIALNSDDE